MIIGLGCKGHVCSPENSVSFLNRDDGREVENPTLVQYPVVERSGNRPPVPRRRGTDSATRAIASPSVGFDCRTATSRSSDVGWKKGKASGAGVAIANGRWRGCARCETDSCGGRQPTGSDPNEPRVDRSLAPDRPPWPRATPFLPETVAHHWRTFGTPRIRRQWAETDRAGCRCLLRSSASRVARRHRKGNVGLPERPVFYRYHLERVVYMSDLRLPKGTPVSRQQRIALPRRGFLPIRVASVPRAVLGGDVRSVPCRFDRHARTCRASTLLRQECAPR